MMFVKVEIVTKANNSRGILSFKKTGRETIIGGK